MPGAADWQNLPNSVTDSISNNDLADSWAQDQQTRIASDWASAQRMVPPPQAPPPQVPMDASAPAGPPEAVYNVQSGDTLSGIAQRLGVPMGQLVSANKISNPNLISAGQTLNIGTGTAAPVSPGAAAAGAKPVASANGNVPDWLVQTIQSNAPDNLKDDPEFLKIVAAGAKAESNWDPRAVQQGGGGRGLFQFDVKGGMGVGATSDQINDPNWQAAKIMPRYAAAYLDGQKQGLKGAELASYVAAQAEHPLGYDNPQSAARQNYRDAYNNIVYTPGQAGATNPPPSPTANQLDLAGTQTTTAGSPLGPQQPAPAQTPGSPVAVQNQRQFETQAGLSDADAYTACGPVAAVAFAQTYGRNPTAQEAIQLAKDVGWNPATGMAGVSSEQALLSKMGVQTKLETQVNWQNVQSDVNNGNPVIVSTPNHYFYISDYDPSSDTYGVGQSGLVFKGGASRMTSSQIAKLGGGVSGALYVDHPQAEGPSVAETTQPPTASQNPVGQAAQGVLQKLGQVKDAVASVLPDFSAGASQTPPGQAPPQQAIVSPTPQSPTAPVTAPLQTSNVLNAGPLAGPSQAVSSTLAQQGGAIQPGNANDLINAASQAGADAIVSASPALSASPTADTTKALVAAGLSIYLGLVQPEAGAAGKAGAATSALGDEQTAIAQAAANGHAQDLIAKLQSLADQVNQVNQAADDASKAATQQQVQASIDDIKAILHPQYDQNGVALRQVSDIPLKTPAEQAAAPAEAATAPQPAPAAAPPAETPPAEAPPAVQFDQNGKQISGPPNAYATPPATPEAQPPTPPPPAASPRPLSGRGGVPGADVGRNPVDVPATPDEAMARFQQQIANMQSRPIDDINALTGGSPAATPPATTAVSPPTQASQTGSEMLNSVLDQWRQAGIYPSAEHIDQLRSSGASDAEVASELRVELKSRQPGATLGPTELGAGVNPGKELNKVLNPAANAVSSVQDAVNTLDQQISGSQVRLEQAVRNGTITQDVAQQAQGQIKGKAFSQFVNDIKNAGDPDAIRPKWQSGTALQRGTSLPKPDGWVDGTQFGNGLEDFYLSPQTRDVVQNIYSQQFKNATPVLTGLNQATSIAKEIALGGIFHMAQTGAQAAGVLRTDAPSVMGKAFVAALDPTGKVYDSMVSGMSQTMARAADAGVTQLSKGLQQGDYAQLLKGWTGLGIRMGTGAVGGALTDQQNPIEGAAKGAAFGAFSSYITPATFERWLPILKAGSFQSLVDRGVTDESAASLVNNLLGGQNLARQARSPLVSELSRTLVLAPDWWESFGRQIAQTVAPSLSPDSVQAKAATFTTLLGLATVTEALSYGFSGHSTLDNPDPAHRADIDMTKVWGKDPKTGQDQYLVIGGRFSDLVNAITSKNADQLVANRAGIAPNVASEALSGQTISRGENGPYSPQNIPASARTGKYVSLNPYPGQPKPTGTDKLISIAADQGKNLYPAGGQSVDKMASRGGLPAAVAAFLTGATERSTPKPSAKVPQ